MMLKKDSLLKGTIILALAALVARVLGLFQKIPLQYMLNDEGIVAFLFANNIYLLLLVVATAGFPSAISKMVSERIASGKPNEAKRIYQASLVFGGVMGILLATMLFIMAPTFSLISTKGTGASLAVRAISPALILFPIIAMMRGYFQGRQMMSAGGISQIVEQFARVLLGLLLGYLALTFGYGDDWAAAAITFGSVFGSISAFAVMLYYARKLKVQDATFARQFNAEARAALIPNAPHTIEAGPKLKFRTIYREILTMSLPALVTSMTINLLYTFDSTFLIRITESFYSLEVATEVLSDLGTKAQSLAGIPPILAIALGSSIIPIISAAFAKNNLAEVNKQTSTVLRIVCITGVPIALLLTVASTSVTGLLFPSVRGSEAVAMLCAGTILQITMMTTNSILYGMGKQKETMVHTITGLIIKIIISVVIGVYFGVVGFIIGSTLCFLVVTYLNIRLIKKDVVLHVLGKKWIPYLIAVGVSAGVAWLAQFGVLELAQGQMSKLVYLYAFLAASILLGLLYGVLLVRFRVITTTDVESLPGKLRGPMLKIMRILKVSN